MKILIHKQLSVIYPLITEHTELAEIPTNTDECSAMATRIMITDAWQHEIHESYTTWFNNKCL